MRSWHEPSCWTCASTTAGPPSSPRPAEPECSNGPEPGLARTPSISSIASSRRWPRRRSRCPAPTAKLAIPQIAAYIKPLQLQRETIADRGRLQRLRLRSASRAYAGIAPVTRRSGTSIKSEFPARSGNKRLKNAMFAQRLDHQQLPRPIKPLLPAQTRRKEKAQRCRHVVGPWPEQRHLRHAHQPRVLP